jgi:hypothetical protein
MFHNEREKSAARLIAAERVPPMINTARTP